jgi:peptide/nickel transport system permease protein
MRRKARPKPSGGSRVVRKLVTHRAALVGGVMISLVILVSLFAPWVAPKDPLALDPGRRLLPPVLREGGPGRTPSGPIMWDATS